ncbi:MAG TPA: YciI family protein [Puia sp.]|nr:YciI family protein [Puia sp.]
MKDFLFIFRGPDYSELNMTAEQSQAAMKKWMDWVGELHGKGQYVAGNPLGKTGKMVGGKKPVITDGPFAEGKELVGGYLIVKADSLEKATELSYGFPDFDKDGSVEVREIIPM